MLFNYIFNGLKITCFFNNVHKNKNKKEILNCLTKRLLPMPILNSNHWLMCGRIQPDASVWLNIKINLL